MSYLPKDPIMLLSYVNTKLRDECKSLDDFCNTYDYPKSELLEHLDTIGYSYDVQQNQFR
ncbi:MAG: DUF4250 domain-containing protein [Ruminococcus sp.]|nr:DUF4250 domain-containing protein [Ruminococcus sp.]